MSSRLYHTHSYTQVVHIRAAILIYSGPPNMRPPFGDAKTDRIREVAAGKEEQHKAKDIKKQQVKSPGL